MTMRSLRDNMEAAIRRIDWTADFFSYQLPRLNDATDERAG